MTMQHSNDWDLLTAKYVIREIREAAEIHYDGWQLDKGDIEEVIGYIDYNRVHWGSFFHATRTAVKQYYGDLEAQASRRLWLATIAEEVEKKNITKKLQDQAI